MFTFDFSNIVRRLGRAAVSAFCSPIAIALYLAGAFALAFSSVISYFLDFSLFLPDFSVDFNLPETSFLQLISYTLDFEGLINTLTSCLSGQITIIFVFINFILAYVVVEGVYSHYQTIRTYIKDLIG